MPRMIDSCFTPVFLETQTGQQMLTFPFLHPVGHKTENNKQETENSKCYAI